MKHRLMVFWLVPIFLASAALCAAQPIASIETQVLRVFSTKKSSYYHKPWKSPDFNQVKASGFFFKDEKKLSG